ncbi:hypothetical protein MJO28_016976, partial [Puccinia striiformis f. sp. tritici]
MLYQLHTAIGQLAVQNIHHVYPHPSKNDEPYADEHQLWLPEAELHWFRVREGMWDVPISKSADFPVSMPFGLGRPYQTPSNGQSLSPWILGQTKDAPLMITMLKTAIGPSTSTQWPPRVKQGQHSAFVQTEASMDSGSSYRQHSRSLRTRGSRMLHVVNTTACCFRRLPRTEILESSYGLDFPMEIVNLHPGYHYQSSPLVKGDRLLIFAGPKRGIEDAILQISIACEWASTYLSGPCKSLYADKKYTSQILASGEYPHSVKRSIYGPSTAPEPKILQGWIIPMSTYESNQVPEGKPTRIHEVPETILSRPGQRGYIKQDLIMPHTSLDPIPWPNHNLNNHYPWYEGVCIDFLMTLDHLEELALGVSTSSPTDDDSPTIDSIALLEGPAHPQTVQAPPANGSRSTKRERHEALDPPGDSKRPRGIQLVDKDTLDGISGPETHRKASAGKASIAGVNPTKRKLEHCPSENSKRVRHTPIRDLMILDEDSKPDPKMLAATMNTAPPAAGAQSTCGPTDTKGKQLDEASGASQAALMGRFKLTRHPSSVYH